MKKDKILGSVLIAAAALIWGLAFVARSEGARHIPAMWFTCLRSILATVALLPVIKVIDSKKKKDGTFKPLKTKKEKKFFWLGAVLCGVSLFLGSYLRQLGLTMGTEPGKAGFITALYIVMVPIISIFMKKKVRPLIWLCVALSVGGLYLLCVSDNTVRASDFVVLLCALFYSLQIIFIEYFSPYVDGVKLSAARFFVAFILSLCFAFFVEDLTLEGLRRGLIPLLYAGIFSSGVAFTFQIIGRQKLSNPTVASLIMSFESVFSVLASALILSQIPSLKEGLGCVVMFIAVILARLPKKENKKQLTNESN